MQTTEQIILNNIRQLPPEKQQEVLDFTEALRKKLVAPTEKLTMRQIAKLPLAQRHQYLAQFIPATAYDFYNDPELTEFAVLDTEDWDIGYE